MKTRISALILAVMLLLSTTSCKLFEKKLPAPETVVSDFVAAIKECDFEKASKFTDDPDEMMEEIEDMYEDIEDQIGNNVDSEEFANTLLKAVFKKAEIKEFKETEIDGDKAKVKLVVNAVNMMKLTKDIMEEYLDEIEEDMDVIFEGVDMEDEDAVYKACDYMLEKFEDALSGDCKMKDGTVKVVLVKGETSWLIDTDEYDELIDSLAGEF